MDSLTIPRPDDMHLHLRDGAALASVVAHTAATFARAVVMPNLKPPVTTTAQAVAYRDRILAALPAGTRFQPLMTLYLTDTTPPDEIARAVDSGVVHAVKLYPAGATTHADAGVQHLDALDATIDAMARAGMPLLVHGEVTDGEVDIFDREAVFLERFAAPLLARHPSLKLVIEHMTTAQAVAFVRAGGPRVAGTITPQHLLLNRNAIFAGGLRPHHYCLPVLKRETHRQALVGAAVSGEPCFFLGTDSAPHARDAKEAACGCAGCYTAPHALALYAEVFDQQGALDRLADFASGFGADFYGLPRATDAVTLVREPAPVPEAFPFAGGEVVPLRAGGTVGWRVVDG
ncbi:MAG: dihydroorotase [Alphaproteobacteria bacterium]|nr:dihydroorotase [Alphaproteobacteria bacterium]